MNEKWFALSVGETEKKLKTNAASGLSRKAARSAWYKSVSKTRPLFVRRQKTFGKMLGEVVADFSLIILMLSAIFALLFDERAVGATVLTVSAISVCTAVAFYFRAQRSMEQINLYFTPTAKVIRGGKLYRISIENVVPGDVILVESGDVVPADARLVVSDNLNVAMRLDKNKYVSLRKQAHGVVSENENDPQKYVNILHAGSVVEEGSGRAIVYAVGGFTYLGAMTGGIAEPYSDNVPKELKKMRRICSQISLFSMLCILPFSIMSLLVSHMSGGTATLSSAFLTALAICASSMTQFSCTLCKIFFIRKINEISSSKNPVAVRTTAAFDKLFDMDYLFLLDGSALTDGKLHFESAFTAEGDAKSFDQPTPTVKILLDMAALYDMAESNALTVGITPPQRFKHGLDELFASSAVDNEALKIRYPIKSYMPGTHTDATDRVIYSDGDLKMALGVSYSEKIFSQCSYAVVNGKTQPLSAVGIDKLRHTYNVHSSKGKTVLVLSVSTFDTMGESSGKVFIGAIVLSENADKSATLGIAAFEKKGIKVISFVGGNSSKDIPQIPVNAQCGVKAGKDEFIRENIPLTYKFGEIGTYYGFNDKDIESLLNHAHEQNKTVAVIGFSDFAPNVIKGADLFISCSSLIDPSSAKSEKELYTLELAGAATSSSCIQTIKAESDIIIQRPDKKKGGLMSLLSAFCAVECAQRNLYGFFKYLISAQFIRILTVALPMAFGKPILDARHVLLCSFIIDIFVLLMLATDKTPVPQGAREKIRLKSLRKHVSAHKKLMLCSLISGLVAIFLPILANVVGIFGLYLYRTEYLFFTVLWLHLTLAYYIRYTSIFNVKKCVKNKLFIALLVSVIVFVAITMLVSPFGLVFDMVYHPIAYFIMSFVPSVIFAVCYELMRSLKKSS